MIFVSTKEMHRVKIRRNGHGGGKGQASLWVRQNRK